MHSVRLFMIVFSVLVLVACSENTPESSNHANGQQMTTPSQGPATAGSQGVRASQGAGGVTVRILPEKPTAKGCLNAVIQGLPGSSTVIWKCNGQVLAAGTDTQFCKGGYQRGDQVTVEVGTKDQGASDTVTIENTPPRVVDISSTPAEIFAGTDITVTPVAEDAELARIAKGLLQKTEAARRPVRLLGVTASKLVRSDRGQLLLF